MRWRAAGAAAALLLGLVAGLGWAAARSGDGAAPGPGSAAGACAALGDPARRPLAGFGEVAFEVAGTDGDVARGCALLAETPEARGRGLMGQRDLRGYDAMVFRFPEPVDGGFYMFQTPVPLSIAFVGADGEVVSTASMAPCEAQDPAACPTTGAAGPYLHAVEVLEGGLDPLGIAPGATVAFGSGVTPPP